MPGVAFSGNTGQAIQLLAGSRLWATAYPPQATRDAPDADIGLQIRFRQNRIAAGPCLPPMQQGLYKEAGDVGDQIVVEADLGSYLFRIEAGVKIVAPMGTWTISAFAGSNDPSPYPQRFWRTSVRPDGDWMPPAFYHLLRVLGGTVQYRGISLATGVEMSLPPGLLTVVGGAVVQIGFDL